MDGVLFWQTGYYHIRGPSLPWSAYLEKTGGYSERDRVYALERVRALTCVHMSVHTSVRSTRLWLLYIEQSMISLMLDQVSQENRYRCRPAFVL